MLRSIPVLVVILLAACGSGSSGGDQEIVDAAPPPPDAAPVADAGPPVFLCGGGELADPEAPSSWYVVDALTVPQTIAQAAEAAMDIDGDDRNDNALGALIATLAGFDLPMQEANTDAIADGRQLQLVSLATATPDDSDAVTVLVRVGADGDDDESDNFSGDEPFDVVPVPEADGSLPGRLSGRALCAGLAPAPILMTVLDTGDTIALPVFAARVMAVRGADGLTQGRLGGGVGATALDEVFIPALADACTAAIERDCPGGVCEEGSGGEQAKNLFDIDDDDAITAEELRSSDLIDGTVNNPDLDLLDGDLPGQDGIKDALSFGMSFTAVPAAAP